MNTQQIDDGGPAFPCGPSGDAITFEDGHTVYQCPAMPGMSLRDWFAGKASERDIKFHQVITTSVVDECFGKLRSREEARYHYADAMLRARKGGAK